MKNKELYLTEVIERENPEFGSNNLILSPVGSGKTTLIKERLAKDIDGRVIMLVSNTFLKNSISPDDNIEREKRGDRTYTTRNRSVYGDGDYRIHTMSYHEFGYRITNNDDSIKDVTQIYCDEIHSLVEYKSYGDNEGLVHAMRYLLNPQEGKQIFYFTATEEALANLKSRQPEAMKYIKQFNYLDYPGIKKYINIFEEGIGHINQLESKIDELSKDFKKKGYKGLIYTKTITSMQDISDTLEKKGYNSLVLWSINNEDYEMTSEQMEARDEIIKSKRIPDEYDFLIINNSMREGWDLLDERVELVVINSTSETDIIQARGRARKNIAKLIYREDGKSPTDEEILSRVLNMKIIGKQLDPKKIDNLVDKLALYRDNGEIIKWRKIKSVMEGNGYEFTKVSKSTSRGRKIMTVINKK